MSAHAAQHHGKPVTYAGNAGHQMKPRGTPATFARATS